VMATSWLRASHSKVRLPSEVRFIRVNGSTYGRRDDRHARLHEQVHGDTRVTKQSSSTVSY
jgi:hypothetical protein